MYRFLEVIVKTKKQFVSANCAFRKILHTCAVDPNVEAAVGGLVTRRKARLADRGVPAGIGLFFLKQSGTISS